MTKRNDEFIYDAAASDGSPNEPISSRSVGSKLLSASVTGVLVVAGLAGGAAFALTRMPSEGASTIGSGSTANSNPSNQQPQTAEANATPGAPAKTIVVPPAAFDDKDGERNFHPKPGSGAAQASTSATPAPLASTPPSFGGGEREGDEKHHRDFGGVRPPRPGHDNSFDVEDSSESDD